MTCRDVDALVTRHVDGELDDARASALRGHLRSCAGCRARVEDEALLRDSAADLPPIDPPAELWTRIQGRLAEAEVADAGRSRAWLWWQRLRPHALTGAVVTAAAGVLLVWALRRDVGEGEPGGAEVATEVIVPPPVESSPPVEPAPPVGPQPTFEQARGDEIARADATYDGVIVELRQVIEAERVSWKPEDARRFDSRLAALEAEVARHRSTAAATPAGRDPLYSALRAQIALLERAAMGDLPR